MKDNTIPPYMDYDIKSDVKKEEIEKQVMKNLDTFQRMKIKIEYACNKSGITYEQAITFMNAFDDFEEMG